jgi:hypothetical protein
LELRGPEAGSIRKQQHKPTPEEIQPLFSCPVYTGSLNDQRGRGKQGQHVFHDAAYFLPVGLARVLEVQEAFPGVDLIYVGGAWNSYTGEAKEYCLAAGIGLFNTTEMNGALYRDDFWTYHKKDKDGNPVYP